jgi:hypothetical protein
LQIHAAGQSIRREVTARGHAGGRVATLGPVYAVEGGLDTYPEFISGPFLYRVGHLLDDYQRRTFVATDSSTVTPLLESDPPAAVLVGLYPRNSWERPMEQYAVAHGYELVPITGFVDGKRAGLRLYVRPSVRRSLQAQ